MKRGALGVLVGLFGAIMLGASSSTSSDRQTPTRGTSTVDATTPPAIPPQSAAPVQPEAIASGAVGVSPDPGLYDTGSAVPTTPTERAALTSAQATESLTPDQQSAVLYAQAALGDPAALQTLAQTGQLPSQRSGAAPRRRAQSPTPAVSTGPDGSTLAGLPQGPYGAGLGNSLAPLPAVEGVLEPGRIVRMLGDGFASVAIDRNNELRTCLLSGPGWEGRYVRCAGNVAHPVEG